MKLAGNVPTELKILIGLPEIIYTDFFLHIPILTQLDIDEIMKFLGGNVSILSTKLIISKKPP